MSPVAGFELGPRVWVMVRVRIRVEDSGILPIAVISIGERTYQVLIVIPQPEFLIRLDRVFVETSD